MDKKVTVFIRNGLSQEESGGNPRIRTSSPDIHLVSRVITNLMGLHTKEEEGIGSTRNMNWSTTVTLKTGTLEITAVHHLKRKLISQQTNVIIKQFIVMKRGK